MELCCRPANDLGDGRGLWEIRRLSTGYTVSLVDPGGPYQFCNILRGLDSGHGLGATAYPVAWEIKRTDDDKYRGSEYVRFHWGATKKVWDLWSGNKSNDAPVYFNELNSNAWQLWKLIPMRVEGTITHSQSSLGSLPRYDDDEPWQSSSHVEQAESECDPFGTVVTKVTIVTTLKRRTKDP